MFTSSGIIYEIKTNTAFYDGQWHHIVATYDGSGNRSGMNLYVDGALVASGIAFGITNDILNDTPVRFGANGIGALELIVGQLDDVKIFDVELTNQQINDIFN